MSKTEDLRTEAIVLRRTNLGESDRILNLITPNGKISVMARSVRKEKSRLAGGIEMFCLSEVCIHQSTKTAYNILTSAKMKQFYRHILDDLDRLELASELIREIAKVSDSVDTPECFNLLKQAFEGLDQGCQYKVVAAWFYLNLANIKGEQINLVTDVNGERLMENHMYVWDNAELALRPLLQGRIGVNEIKIMRLMLSNNLNIVSRILSIEKYISEILHVAKSVNQF